MLLGGGCEVGAVLADPRLDVLATPDLAHGQLIVGGRPVVAGHQLVDALAADAEARAEFANTINDELQGPAAGA